ncbi:MAG TPA: alpha/beta hydrolase-fold protein [Longimicrobiaceae bacterium]|nr:alpha/beta hydrolase-fold protein [Longimicrobiaceae bacterium]
MNLLHEIDLPDRPADGAPLIVLLHGRGSDRYDLLGLRRGLPADAILVTPQAPYAGAPWGYGPGWAWYRYIGDDRPESESFERSQTMLAEFLDELPGQLPVRPGLVAVGGFSQGGTMGLAAALRRPASVPNVLNFSGFLANHPSVEVTPESVRGTRIFWGHGTDDPAIPYAMAERGREALRAAGADLTAKDYRIGHWIDPEELRAANDWLREAMAAAEEKT